MLVITYLPNRKIFIFFSDPCVCNTQFLWRMRVLVIVYFCYLILECCSIKNKIYRVVPLINPDIPINFIFMTPFTSQKDSHLRLQRRNQACTWPKRGWWWWWFLWWKTVFFSQLFCFDDDRHTSNHWYVYLGTPDALINLSALSTPTLKICAVRKHS